MKEEVKELWRLCFPEDTQEFVELYFSEKYTDDITSSITVGGRTVSALQRIPYPMTYKGLTVPTAYVSGACTHPLYRSQGLMTRLLYDAHRRMYADGMWLSVLIPANEGLIAFYGKSHYAPVFKERTEVFTHKRDDASTQTHGYSFSKATSAEDIARFVYSLQAEKPCCILHTTEDMTTVTADHLLYSGDIWTAHRANGSMASVAFVAKEGDELFVKEIISACDEAQRCTIEFLLNHYRTGRALHHFPTGMARVINACKLLETYSAACKPHCVIEVYGDDAIAENNALYHLHHGTCTKLLQRPYGNDEVCISLSISQLAEFVFRGEEPYMSLMLN